MRKKALTHLHTEKQNILNSHEAYLTLSHAIHFPVKTYIALHLYLKLLRLQELHP